MPLTSPPSFVVILSAAKDLSSLATRKFNGVRLGGVQAPATHPCSARVMYAPASATLSINFCYNPFRWITQPHRIITPLSFYALPDGVNTGLGLVRQLHHSLIG